MRKAVLITARAVFAAVATSVLGVAMLAASAAAQKASCASSAGKCFGVTVSSSSPPAGGTVSFTFTVTNEASTQQIGSFQITAPAPFLVTDAAVLSSPGTASHTSSSALFTNLSVAPSAAIQVTVTALLPCSGSSYQWGMQVKQSNDFSGLPGNNFQIDPARAGNLSGMVAGACSLAFTSDGQPAGAAVAAKIAAGFGSQGGPVKVALLDASGLLITSSAATGPVTVTVKIDPHSNPGGGSLSGTTTETISGGVASFPAQTADTPLSINKSGVGYALIASTMAPGISTSVPSADFTIFGSLKSCSGKGCSASLSSTTTTGTVTTSSAAPANSLLGAGIGGASYNCTLADGTTYQSFSDPFSFDVFTTDGNAQQDAKFSASVDISKSAVKSSGRNQVADWQLCYASMADFSANAMDGTYTSGGAVIGGVSFNTGLLLDCSTTQGASPCVQSRAKGNGGDVIITFLASGDPFGKG